MKPKRTNHTQGRLFEQRLSEQLNPNHELLVLSRILRWNSLEDEFIHKFDLESGAPAKPVRLVIGIMILQHMYGLSDEGVVAGWIENPYWQLFCGYDYLQWKFPIHPTTLTKWRKRLGVKGMERVLELLVDSALRSGFVKEKSLSKVIVDTTVMPKAIAYPTDTELYLKGLKELVRFANANKIRLRQTYTRKAPKTARLTKHLMHGRKFKRARRELQRLRNYLGRVLRDILRQLDGDQELQKRAAPVLCIVGKIYLQDREDKNKIYSLHEPHVECISKGKAHKKYEFGCKASIVLTHKEGLVLSAQALHGNPYDGHTLSEALNHAEEISGHKIDKAFVDRGYKGNKIQDREIFMSRNKKGVHWRQWKEISRRQAIEPHIGHMKSDGKLGRNFLKGKLGDRLNAILCAVGHNARLIINYLKTFQRDRCSA